MIVSCHITPEQDVLDAETPDAPRKKARWENLPRCQLPTQSWQIPIRYQQENDDEVSTHVAHVAVSRLSLCKAMQTSEADRWRQAMQDKYNQLINKGVFKEVNNLPLGKKAVESKIVFKEKLNSQENHMKFKNENCSPGLLPSSQD